MSWQEVKNHSGMTFMEHIASMFETMEKQVTLVILLIGSIILAYLVFEGNLKTKKNRWLMSVFAVILCVVFVFLSLFFSYPWGPKTMRETNHYQDWIKQYVVPYMNELPDTEQEVTQLLTFTPDEEKKEVYILNTIELYEKRIKGIKDDDLLMVEFMYKSKNNVVNMYKGFAYIQYEKDRRVPIVTFKKIEHDLGNGIAEGFYAPILYLPQDFNIQENWSKEGVK